MLKDKRGTSVGAIVMVFIAVIVGLALITGNGIAGNVAASTKTQSSVNHSVTSGASAGLSVELHGSDIVGTPTVINGSSGTVILGNNFTFVQGIGADGQTALLMKTNAGAVTSGFAGKTINVTYTYEPDGYIKDAGARGIYDIVVVFSVLLIAVAALLGIKKGIFE